MATDGAANLRARDINTGSSNPMDPSGEGGNAPYEIREAQDHKGKLPNSTVTSEAVRQARVRVDGYLNKVRELPYNTRDIARSYPIIRERSGTASDVARDDVKIAVVTIDHNGSADDELFDSVEALSPVLDAMVDEAASGLNQKCRFFVIKDLSADVVKTFGGYLDIDPAFFIDHVEGGETVPIYYDCHLADASPYFDDNTSWHRHTWRRSGRMDYRLGSIGQTAKQISIWARKRVAFIDSGFPYGYQLDLRNWWPAIGLVLERGRNKPQIRSKIFRPVSATGTGDGFDACFQERISIYVPDQQAIGALKCGLILVDSPMTVEDQSGENALPRQWPLFHSVDLWIFTGSKPSIILEQYKSTQDQIVAHLLQFVGQNPQHITEHLEISVLFQIARFWKNTLQTLGHSLDAIDYSISDDARIVENLKRWRYLLGIWRPLVPRFRSELEESINNLIDTGIFFEEGPKRVDQLRGIFSEFLVTCTLLQERVERTSQALMSTLSIIESQNAIRQGHEIQKLTELAFVFVPMSFAATYFGMEVHEWSDDNKPKLKYFWVMAAVLVFGIYALRGFLYGDVYRGLQDTFYQHVKEYTRNRSGEKSVHNRLRIRDAILYTTHNAAFQVLSMLLITVCLPIILIWTCAPDTWAHYISLSVTLVWLWTILPLVVILFQKVWHDTWGWDFAQLIIYVYGVAVVGFTLAFPALLISIGNVPQISPWSRTLRISVSVAVPIGLFIFMCVVAEILSRRYPTSWLWSRIWRYLTKRVRVLTPPAPNTE